MAEQKEEDIRTIRQINAQIRSVLEHETVGYPMWVGGVIARNYISDRGHMYFDLSDDDYTINCFLREPIRGTLDFTLSTGMEIEVFGEIRVFEPQAKIQIDVAQARLVKRPLFVIDSNTREQLEKKGLWPRAKKPLPENIRAIGLITSKNSRALQDFEDTYREANGQAQVRLVDVPLQGQRAPREIADAITRLNRDNAVDVIAIIRGGGRATDLAIFNDFLIGEAICRSSIPIVTGIGHQRDETFADQVADMSAITPTAAAHYLVKRKFDPQSGAAQTSIHTSTRPMIPYLAIGIIAIFAMLIILVLLLVNNAP